MTFHHFHFNTQVLSVGLCDLDLWEKKNMDTGNLWIRLFERWLHPEWLKIRNTQSSSLCVPKQSCSKVHQWFWLFFYKIIITGKLEKCGTTLIKRNIYMSLELFLVTWWEWDSEGKVFINVANNKKYEVCYAWWVLRKLV